jgi:hypothetical protein
MRPAMHYSRPSDGPLLAARKLHVLEPKGFHTANNAPGQTNNKINNEDIMPEI